MKRVMRAAKKIDPCLLERLGGVLLPYCSMAKEGLLRGHASYGLKKKE